MAKFKVGDKVRVRDDADGYYMEPPMKAMRGKTVTISYVDSDDKMQYKIAEFRYWWDESLFKEIATEQPRREFIVIRRSGAETIAELRHDREVIKSAKATCNASDTFDLDTGAKLAFDRLMGRDEKPITGKSFDRIFVDDIAPAPEPPKFYTGKVFAVEAACRFPGDSALARNGHVFEIIDGIIMGDLTPYGMDNDKPYDSFGAFKDRWFSTTWHEVKSDVH